MVSSPIPPSPIYAAQLTSKGLPSDCSRYYEYCNVDGTKGTGWQPEWGELTAQTDWADISPLDASEPPATEVIFNFGKPFFSAQVLIDCIN